MVSKIVSANRTQAAQVRKPAAPKTSDFANALKSAESGQTKKATNLDDIFRSASEKYGVPLNLLKAVAKAESGFDPSAVSSCGAEGIMQLMPSTADSLGVQNAFDPEQNVMGGAKYLGQLLSSFGGDSSLAVAAYNAGSGAVRKYGGIPPYKETQNYVKKVLGYAGMDVSVPDTALNSGTSSADPSVLSAIPAAGIFQIADVAFDTVSEFRSFAQAYVQTLEQSALQEATAEAAGNGARAV